MPTRKRIVIIGTGIAGSTAAVSARSQDSCAEIILIGEEPHFPYDRTHLSKQQLDENANLSTSILITSAAFKELNIHLVTGVKVRELHTDEHFIVLDNGEQYLYDKLIVATGSSVRPLPDSWGCINDERIHSVRTAEDSHRLRIALGKSEKIVVIGAGLIGLEVAVVAREKGIDVTVAGPGKRILTRSCDEVTADRLESIHRDNGVHFRLGMSVEAIRKLTSGELEVFLSDGSTLAADNVVVGIGVLPNVAVVSGTDIEINDGIVVDRFGQTNIPDIFAAGEVVSLLDETGTSNFRLETWRHSQEHGRLVGENVLNNEMRAYELNSSFWSDQYGHRLQGVGLIPPENYNLIVRVYDDHSHISFCIGANQKLLAVVGLDDSKDVNAVGRLVGFPLTISTEVLEDASKPLVPLVKSILKKMK